MQSLYNLLIVNLRVMDEKIIMITIMNLIDVVVIANLLIIIIVGGYKTFVSRLRVDDSLD